MDKKLSYWCQSCRMAGIVHCSDPVRCGGMAQIPFEEAQKKFDDIQGKQNGKNA
jgi:hypothetical protein